MPVGGLEVYSVGGGCGEVTHVDRSLEVALWCQIILHSQIRGGLFIFPGLVCDLLRARRPSAGENNETDAAKMSCLVYVWRMRISHPIINHSLRVCTSRITPPLQNMPGSTTQMVCYWLLDFFYFFFTENFNTFPSQINIQINILKLFLKRVDLIISPYRSFVFLTRKDAIIDKITADMCAVKSNCSKQCGVVPCSPINSRAGYYGDAGATQGSVIDPFLRKSYWLESRHICRRVAILREKKEWQYTCKSTSLHLLHCDEDFSTEAPTPPPPSPPPSPSARSCPWCWNHWYFSISKQRFYHAVVQSTHTWLDKVSR